MTFSPGSIEKIVLLQKIVSIGMIIVSIIGIFAGNSELIVTIVLYTAFFYMLKTRRSWTIPFGVLMYGGYSILLFISPPIDKIGFFVKYTIIFFSIFTIYFLTRKEVKKYFGYSSTIIF